MIKVGVYATRKATAKSSGHDQPLEPSVLVTERTSEEVIAQTGHM
jgi:hypothetical protein